VLRVLRHIEQGDLSARIDAVSDGDEIGALQLCVNSMVAKADVSKQITTILALINCCSS
jgi:HAMP domain-containing protein